MSLDKDRWKTISPSQFPWEQEALDYVRQQLSPPWALRAWSNFEVVESSGRRYEIDLLLLTVRGFFMVEIKSFPGLLYVDEYQFVRKSSPRAPAVSEDNPITTTNHKCKVLKHILERQPSARGVELPYLQAVVFLSHPDLEVQYRPGMTQVVFTRKDFLRFLGQPAAGAPVRPAVINTRHETAIVKALAESGISGQTLRTIKVGDWVLGQLLGEGPEYQDYHARHASLETMERRVRIYTAHLDDKAGRERATRAAKREFALLDGVHHEGILRPHDLKESELGLGLVYDFYPEAMRLDQFMTSRGERLDLKTRLLLWRQLADILRYAHDRRILHRSLAPQNILVTRPDQSLPPMKVMNWQTGRAEDLTTGTQHIEDLVEDLTTAYIAPESLTDPTSTGSAADLFSLGCVGYFLLSGHPPAASQIELMQKLVEYPGLRLSTVLDGAPEPLCQLVAGCTHPDVNLRLGTVSEFLEVLNHLEAEILANPEPPEREVDPFTASPGESLGHGLKLVRRLGQGAISAAFLVERARHENAVLKLALHPEQNHRLETEAEVLALLKDRQIVELKERLRLGDRTGLLLSFAGDETLAEYLAKTGTIPLELLQRFGEDLLRLLQVLEQEGVSHRDIKPSNLGVAQLGKQELHLVLFDFSLAKASPTDLAAGTTAYLDPFLQKRKRWDGYAERYAAGVTLYEMATGSLPRWGDGKSHPALVECELVLEAERFEASLRPSLTAFFQRALAREVADRFDNAEEMRRAWVSAFAAARPQPVHETPRVDWSQLQPETPLAELGLSPTALQALDRTGLMTAGQLLAYPRSRLRSIKGLGAQTRKEILACLAELEGRLAAAEPVATAEKSGLDRLVELLVETGKKPGKPLRRAFLGLAGDLPPWPSLGEVARSLGKGALEVTRGMPETRIGWRKIGELEELRGQLARLLEPLGGIASAEELAAAVLTHSGSLSNDPAERLRRARAALRAALEVEGLEEAPRFGLHRLQTSLLVASDPESAGYAVRLGDAADRLAAQEPLPARPEVVRELRAVPPPENLPELSEARLVRLAVETAQKATLSSKGELYPRGMDARRALVLAHGALLEASLPPARIQERVQSRYPEAQPLPGRPELDGLLAEAGLELTWSEAENAYRRRDADKWTSSGTLNRRSTSGHGPRVLTPEVLAAQQTEERLSEALRKGEALVLTARSTDLGPAEQELLGRFGLRSVALDEELLGALEQEASQRKIPWDTLVKADAAGSKGPHWSRLTQVVEWAVQRLEAQLASSPQPLLLKNAGLLARYQPRLELVERLLLASGTQGAPPAVWVLASVSESGELPRIDQHALPLPPARPPMFLPKEWLRNLHRAASV